MTTIEQVKEFHETFGTKNADKPNIGDYALNKLRLRLLQEELNELQHALDHQDAVEVLDALTDLQYVLDGAYLTLGYAQWKDAAFAEVQRSNMTKLTKDGKVLRDTDGKVLKSDQFEEPNLKKIMFPEQPVKQQPQQQQKRK